MLATLRTFLVKADFCTKDDQVSNTTAGIHSYTQLSKARSLRACPHERFTLIMVGFFTTKATIKIKHLMKEELIRMEKYTVLGTHS